MSLNIKNIKTHQLAHELVAMTGESLTTAITCALEERIERLTPKNSLKEELMQLSRDCAALIKPELKNISHGDYLYDEMGLPK